MKLTEDDDDMAAAARGGAAAVRQGVASMAEGLWRSRDSRELGGSRDVMFSGEMKNQAARQNILPKLNVAHVMNLKAEHVNHPARRRISNARFEGGGTCSIFYWWHIEGGHRSRALDFTMQYIIASRNIAYERRLGKAGGAARSLNTQTRE
ncbi:hypothetical protein G7046_g1058 [Stylonectria norvegica]|nr:hypothetical protein G7046_g1058 [Stylonectria norvegica]